ncbi:MAG: hypothetical protein CL441_01160 [Acidimicrobiaceae bacterium]|nr:hypothetical protein [Acidimicrobiaceae bacterium]
MRDLHQTLAWAIVLGNGLAGGWALAAHRVARLRHRALWAVTGLAQVLLLAQAWAGAAIAVDEGIDVDAFHLFYGAAALLSAGVAWGYRRQLADRVHLLYGGVGLWIMGLGIRAMVLG